MNKQSFPLLYGKRTIYVFNKTGITKRSTFYLIQVDSNSNTDDKCKNKWLSLQISSPPLGINVSKAATFFHYNGTFPPGYTSTKTVFTYTKTILKTYMKVGNATWMEPKISFKGSS